MSASPGSTTRTRARRPRASGARTTTRAAAVHAGSRAAACAATRTSAGAGARTYDASIDEGLRSYMIRVYNLMALAMGITALFAAGTVMLATTNNPAAAAASLPNGTMLTALGTVIYGSPLRWVIMLAPLALA